MRNLILLTLLLLSKQFFCQNTATKSIDIPVQQVTELYKGLKQNEYLKSRLQKTENTLKSADQLILEQQKSIESAKYLIASKDQIIKTKDEIYSQNMKASGEREYRLKNDIEVLQEEAKYLKKESQEKQRKKFWSGVKVGSIGALVLGAVAIIAMNQ